MANITLPQMLMNPFVVGVFSRLRAPGLVFQNFYNMRPESPGTEHSPTRHMSYDVFDNTRTLARARAPMTPPARQAPKKIGVASATALRIYESIPLHYEKIYQTRPLGGNFGDLDATGRSYVGRQQKFAAQRIANSVEFMLSRMFRGGFSILIDGDDHWLRELGGGTIDVTYNIPADNKTQVQAGTGADIIDASWDNAATTIAQQLLNLNKAAERQTGYPVRHFWINSTTYGEMLNNNQLAAIKGTANRIFDTQTRQQIDTTEGRRESGFTVIFGAMPQYEFHVYDGVLNVSTNTDSDTLANTSLFVPDNICIATPEPGVGEWYGMATSQEPIREFEGGPVENKVGLSTWSRPTDEPPGEELRVLHNLVPLLYVPKAVYYMTVIF